MKYSLIALFVIAVTGSCNSKKIRQADKKVFYINSYHEGYPASDEIMKGLLAKLGKERIDVKTFFLDTKRNPGSEQVKEKVQQVLDEIKRFDPDLLIVSDDAAVKYVIAPYLYNSDLPVVFCGVNWSAAQYGLPVKNVTGMLEVLPLRQNLLTMREYYPQATKLTVLSEKSLSEEKNTALLDTLYKNLGFTVQYEMADNFRDWQQRFIEANRTADMIYLPTNGAIKGWNAGEAKAFVREYIAKPVITCDDFMMPYCVYGLTKVAAEQGSWAGETALAILHGRAPADIAVTYNKEVQSFINETLAERTGFKPSPVLLKGSHIIK